MATTTELDELRALTDVAANDAVFTPPILSGLIDEMGMNAAAASVWRRKAASYSSLVDVSESGSSRSMSQLFKNASAQAESFQALAEAENVVVPLSGRTRIRSIERF
jgi:hypothetical protein